VSGSFAGSGWAGVLLICLKLAASGRKAKNSIKFVLSDVMKILSILLGAAAELSGKAALTAPYR
jgi:hypothetical protein